MDIKIEDGWKHELQHEFQQPYFNTIAEQVRRAYRHTRVFPPAATLFAAFDNTPFERVKVVILGQDPYHRAGQAHGLCFSVLPPTPAPPSLVNIFRELREDIGVKRENPDLRDWAQQGVFLLNSVLSVEEGRAGSHSAIGWQTFTDACIALLSAKKEHLVFILWGRYAQNKQALIDHQKHLILTSAHPSPLSAHNGFFGCRHFSKTNDYLRAHGIEAIQWGSQH